MSTSHTVTATYKAKASTGSSIEVQAAGLPIEVNRMIVHAMTKPDEVQTMLAQREELLKALRVARDFIATDRQSLADASTAPDGSIDPDDAAAVADYDQALEQIDAAIKSATGEQA